MNHSKGFLISLRFRPDVFADKNIVQSCSDQVKKSQRQGKQQKELQVFLFEDKLRNQIIDCKISNDNIQRKFNQVRFKGIPIVVINCRKSKKVKDKID